MKPEKLLACPFCGGRAVFEEIEKFEIGLSFPDWCVSCRKCEARGPNGGSMSEGKVKAAKLWNGAKR